MEKYPNKIRIFLQDKGDFKSALAQLWFTTGEGRTKDGKPYYYVDIKKAEPKKYDQRPAGAHQPYNGDKYKQQNFDEVPMHTDDDKPWE